MSDNIEEIRYKLRADEPDYEELKKLGKNILPHLQVIAKNIEDPLLATKAIYLSSLLDIDDDTALSEDKIDILMDASKSPTPEVRVSAALGVANIIPDLNSQGDSDGISRIANLLISLQEDNDIGILKIIDKIINTQGDMLGGFQEKLIQNQKMKNASDRNQ